MSRFDYDDDDGEPRITWEMAEYNLRRHLASSPRGAFGVTVQPLEEKLAITGAFMQTAERLPTIYSLSNEFRALVDLLEEPEWRR